ncbi:MAG: hypothetical protein F6K28_43795, partial [Microcoleus sp. SIO2G3]|nr:hypothetical protein [Microcoleus sp. SIO2G3]
YVSYGFDESDRNRCRKTRLSAIGNKYVNAQKAGRVESEQSAARTIGLKFL